MNVFTARPKTKAQRDRWFALIDAVTNERLTSYEQLMESLERRGHPITHPTLLKDLRRCRIVKSEGVYQISPITTNQVLEDILKSRFRIVAESVYRSGDLVVINTNQGAGPWLERILRDMNHEDVASYNVNDDSLWLLAPEGRGDQLYSYFRNMLGRAMS